MLRLTDEIAKSFPASEPDGEGLSSCAAFPGAGCTRHLSPDLLSSLNQIRVRMMGANACRRTQYVIDSPELYDAIYHFKNYARECDRLRSLINEFVPGARTILDVACGTGAHAKFLKHHYAVDGIDINESYLRAARLKNPSGNYTRADMMNFDLGGTYDVVTCLFSAIGYRQDLRAARACDRLHGASCKTRGALIIGAMVHTPSNGRPPGRSSSLARSEPTRYTA